MIRLRDVYGKFLSSKQAEIFDLYYDSDCSLHEISEIIGLSRQGVQECIKKSIKILNGCESGIGLIAAYDSCFDEENNFDNIDRCKLFVDLVMTNGRNTAVERD